MTDWVRRLDMEGREIAVFDDLAPRNEIARYAATLARAAYTRTESARVDTEYRHWVCETPVENLLRIDLWPFTQRALEALRPGERYKPYRVYTNYAAFGDMLLTHVDAPPDAREITALWFLCETWDVEWGGETVFFDSTGDAQAVVSPRPGRLILFDGAIRHVGRPPNRVCFTPRLTFAIKLRAC